MKVAIVGSAPSSVGLAPYEDPSWEIWGCSGGAQPHVRRVSAWFELHHYGPGDPAQYAMSAEYVAWLKTLPKVYMHRQHADIPGSVVYPKEAILAEFGGYFFTSSVAWMLALAIQQGATEIALFGIDMAARDEYEYQRPGCHHFLTMAQMRGIKITVPPQSDLLKPPPMYGLRVPCEKTVKLMVREGELRNRLQQAQARQDAAFREVMFLQGALDDLDYMKKIWIDQDPKSIAGG